KTLPATQRPKARAWIQELRVEIVRASSVLLYEFHKSRNFRLDLCDPARRANRHFVPLSKRETEANSKLYSEQLVFEQAAPHATNYRLNNRANKGRYSIPVKRHKGHPNWSNRPAL